MTRQKTLEKIATGGRQTLEAIKSREAERNVRLPAVHNAALYEAYKEKKQGATLRQMGGDCMAERREVSVTINGEPATRYVWTCTRHPLRREGGLVDYHEWVAGCGAAWVACERCGRLCPYTARGAECCGPRVLYG